MKTTLLHQFTIIPRLTAAAGKAEGLAHKYVGWQLLDVDARAQAILICKPCAATWDYTKSKHLLILCGEAAVAWKRNAAASVYDMSDLTADEHKVIVTRADVPRRIDTVHATR